MRCQASVCPEDTYAMGRVLAEVHLAGAPRMRAGRFRVADLLTRCEQIGQDASDDLRGMGSQLADALAQAEAQRLPGLPKGLCHGDLFRDNVLWQGPKLAALLDFESAAEGPFAFDVAVTLLAWCFFDDFVPALLASLVAGYTSRRPLTADERLGLFAEARVAALRFTITRVTDYAMRAHLGVTEVRDWRRFFKRYERLGDLGPAGFAALFETGCFPSGTSQGASSP